MRCDWRRVLVALPDRATTSSLRRGWISVRGHARGHAHGHGRAH